MTKVADGNTYSLNLWADGTRRSYPQPPEPPPPPPVPEGDPLFPRTLCIWNGTPQNYDLPAFQVGAAKFDKVIFNQWENWEAGRTMTFAQVCANIKALNPNTKIYQYIMMEGPFFVGENGSNRPVLWAMVNQQNWWLRNSWPNGGILTDSWPVQKTNPSDAAQNPLNGKLYSEWFMGEYLPDMYVRGVYPQHAANPNLDGFFLDNTFLRPDINGDWNCDGTSDTANSQTISESWRRGHKLGATAYKLALPNHDLICNATELTFRIPPPGVTYPDTIMGQTFDGGLSENITGDIWSLEQFDSPANIIAGSARHASWMIDPTKQDTNSVYSGGFAGLSKMHAARYAICLMLCVTDGYIAHSDDASFGSTTGEDRTAKWFDEYDNAGKQRYYLGTAVDSVPLTGPWQLGVYRRRFAGGWVLWNPRGNGVRTVSLGQSMKKIQGRTGFSDTTVNNGATVTSVTLQDRDGLILLNV